MTRPTKWILIILTGIFAPVLLVGFGLYSLYMAAKDVVNTI